MKIAIHPFEKGFSDSWIPFLEKNQIEYKLVNCYSSDIIENLKGCDCLIWQWTQADPIAMMMAYDLTKAIEASGIKVFPSSNNSWHFDDKVAQKYYLESIDAPLVKSYVFYSKIDAENWVNKTDFPKVFKLKGGAGSNNVKLVYTKNQAKKLIGKSFSRGFPKIDRTDLFDGRVRKFKLNPSKGTFFGLFKGLARLFIKTDLEKIFGRDRGYAYFQDFIPCNDHDIRVIIIGDRAFGIKRMVRSGDFRASGSGLIVSDKNQIPESCLKLAFEVCSKIDVDCLCFDFVFQNDKPKIVEISFGFAPKAYLELDGYWTKDLNYNYEKMPLANYILIDVLKCFDKNITLNYE